VKRPYKHIDLGDKFSDFEHTPNDSVWNNVTGGLNSEKGKGALADKFDSFNVKPNKSVWSAIAAANHPERKRRGLVYWTSGIAASVVLGLLLFTGNNDEFSSSVYTPRGENYKDLAWENDLEESLKVSEDLDFITSAVNSAKNETGLSKSDSYKEPDSGVNIPLTEGEVQEGLAENSIPQNKNGDKIPSSNNLENLALNDPDKINDKLINSTRNKDDLDSIIKVYIVKSEELEYLNPRYRDDFTTVFDTDQPIGFTNNWWLSEDGSPGINRTRSTVLNAVSQFNESSSDLALNSTNSLGVGNDMESAETFTTVIEEAANIGFTSAEEFKAPIYITLNLERRLSIGAKSRLRAGLGLGALIMNSSTEFSSSTITSNTQITRNYIAVPVGLKYDFIKRPRWNVYTGTGVTSEFGLSGKSTVRDFSGGEEINMTVSRFNLGAGQFNVNTSLGGSLLLSPKISVFAEAGLSHYFYESSYNFWSNQKLWPSLKTGLGFQF